MAESKYTPKYIREKCGDCVHWNEIPINESLQRSGMCRLFPPSPIVIPSVDALSIQFVYPQVGKDNGACGGFVDLADLEIE